MARLAILETGLWDVPRNEIIAAETPEIYAENRRHKIPGFSVLIQDKKLGNILWDTGITADWEANWGEEFKRNYTFDKLCKLDEVIARDGHVVRDVFRRAGGPLRGQIQDCANAVVSRCFELHGFS